jgi:HPt (histidine-containing phosphotransfer) domain-containing protein
MFKVPEDPFVLELLPEFVDTWINDYNEQFQNLISDKNSADLYRFAHTLKGSCFQFGIDEIANLGIQLMGYAKNEDWENASAMGDTIIQKFIEVREYISNLSPDN